MLIPGAILRSFAPTFWRAANPPRVKLERQVKVEMRTDCFTENALREAYTLAAERDGADFAEYAETSAFDFSLAINVECDTGLPVSTPAELREKKFQQKLKQSQTKANKIADRQRRVAEALAKKVTRKMRKEQRGQ